MGSKSTIEYWCDYCKERVDDYIDLIKVEVTVDNCIYDSIEVCKECSNKLNLPNYKEIFKEKDEEIYNFFIAPKRVNFINKIKHWLFK